MKKAIGWIRVSTEAQAGEDRASIPAQRSDNHRTAMAHGLEIVRTMEITDVSGASVMEAPEMKELLRLVEDPEIVGVVARDFSRLSRERMSVTMQILEHFADNRITLYTLDGPMNPADFAGMLLGTFRGLMAHKERTDLLAKVWAAKEMKRRRGELAQNRMCLPKGVGYEQGRGFFYKREAEPMREVFSLFLSGEPSYIRLAKLMGVTPRGIHIMMRNPIWTGYRVIDKKRDPSPAGRYTSQNGRQSDRRKIARPPEEVIRVRVIGEPLISPAEWQRVQEKMNLKQQRHWRSRPNRESRFTYAGFLTCASCGSPMLSRLHRADYYICGRRLAHHCPTPYLNRVRLEAELDRLITEKLTDHCFLSECARKLERRASSGEIVRRRQHLKAEIASLERQRTRVVDSWVKEEIDREDYDRRRTTLDQELRAHKQALDAAEAESPTLNVAQIAGVLSGYFNWDNWPQAEKRQALGALTPDIRVAAYQVDSIAVRLPADVGKETRSRAGIITILRATATARSR